MKNTNYILETERLYLRELTALDAKNFYMLNLDPEVMKYTGDVPFKSIDSAKQFLENYSDYKNNGVGRWVVILKSTQAFIGWCGIKYTSELDEYDIGYRFFKNHWHKGYATEAAKACIDLGFKTHNIKTIVGRAMTENKASIKVLEKIGLAHAKNFDFDGNDGVIYKMNNPFTKNTKTT
ncbi:GNAT family N-acetyltransferase [Pontimicrobium sp. IMCC45349]|uniref:GNAT family N-acetyltransferase n=1 Tax=Pontimicrobium sp. IMCC45349 TaxID=3391574 RepID=UPI0039A26EE2